MFRLKAYFVRFAEDKNSQRPSPTTHLTSGPPRHFFLSFLGFSIVTNYRTYTLYLLSTTKATTNLVKRFEDVPQRFSFPPNAELAIRPSPPILMRWPCT